MPRWHIQRLWSFHMLGLHLLSGLRIYGGWLSELRERLRQLRPMPCWLCLRWRKQYRCRLHLLARLRLNCDGEQLLRGHARLVCALLSSERLRWGHRAAH